MPSTDGWSFRPLSILGEFTIPYVLLPLRPISDGRMKPPHKDNMPDHTNSLPIGLHFSFVLLALPSLGLFAHTQLDCSPKPIRHCMIEENQVYRFPFSFSQADVVQFAQVTGDDNPLHLDAGYAAGTVFKQPIIHGFLGGSVFSRVFGTLFPGEGTIYLKQSMEFVRPMLVDTEYEATFTVKETNREKHQAIITTEIADKRRGKVVVKGEATVMHAEKI